MTWREQIRNPEFLASWIVLQQNEGRLDAFALCGVQGLQWADQSTGHKTQCRHRCHQHGKTNLDSLKLKQKVAFFVANFLLWIFVVLLLMSGFYFLLFTVTPTHSLAYTHTDCSLSVLRGKKLLFIEKVSKICFDSFGQKVCKMPF